MIVYSYPFAFFFLLPIIIIKTSLRVSNDFHLLLLSRSICCFSLVEKKKRPIYISHRYFFILDFKIGISHIKTFIKSMHGVRQ
jgi:hypothetical protein